MLMLLAVVALVFVNMRNPAMWGWVTQGRGATAVVGDKPDQADPSHQAKSEAAAPDEDWEEQSEVAQEFQAVLDGSLEIQPEENFAYARLFSWIQQQSWDDLCRRSRNDVVFADLMHSPAKYRGRLLKLDLNVRRVLTYPVDNRLIKARQMYEIWGFTEDSKAWLYDVVTDELPAGMPIGPDVMERAKFVGYFFKLQGYYEAGAKPRATPLRAPLLVGRLVRYPSATELQSRGIGWWELGAAAIVAAMILTLVLVQRAFFRHADHRRAQAEQQTGDRTRQWLAEEFPTTHEISDNHQAAEAEEMTRSPSP
jgi:hypothetical protein